VKKKEFKVGEMVKVAYDTHLWTNPSLNPPSLKHLPADRGGSETEARPVVVIMHGELAVVLRDTDNIESRLLLQDYVEVFTACQRSGWIHTDAVVRVSK